MERGRLRDDDVLGGRAALGGEGEAWGKSKLPVVKGKVAGGGDGDGGGLGMVGDVGAAEHGRGERARWGVENRGRDAGWLGGGSVGGDVVYTYVAVWTLESGTRVRYFTWMRAMDGCCMSGLGNGRAGKSMSCPLTLGG